MQNKLNYRSKLRPAGCNDVSVNRKLKDTGNGCVFTLKKAKRGEVNHVTEYPDKPTATSLEGHRLQVMNETKKAKT